jgi:Lon protease-like protein
MQNKREFRVFPLPGITLFPGMLLPLKIFEHRYLELLDMALQDDRRFVMALIRPDEMNKISGDPCVLPMAGEGEIVHCEAMNDKTYHVVLEGRERIQLIHEKPKMGQIRIFSGICKEDIFQERDPKKLEHLMEILRERVQSWVRKRLPASVHQSVLDRLNEAPSVGNLIDRMSSLVVHVVSHRQALIETLDVFQRAKILENLTRWAGVNGPFGHTTMN